MTTHLDVAELERWTGAGATLRVVTLVEDLAVVDLCACTGEPVERRRATAPDVLAWLRAWEAGGQAG